MSEYSPPDPLPPPLPVFNNINWIAPEFGTGGGGGNIAGPQGPFGPAGPQGDIGFQGPAGGGTPLRYNLSTGPAGGLGPYAFPSGTSWDLNFYEWGWGAGTDGYQGAMALRFYTAGGAVTSGYTGINATGSQTGAPPWTATDCYCVSYINDTSSNANNRRTNGVVSVNLVTTSGGLYYYTITNDTTSTFMTSVVFYSASLITTSPIVSVELGNRVAPNADNPILFNIQPGNPTTGRLTITPT